MLLTERTGEDAVRTSEGGGADAPPSMRDCYWPEPASVRHQAAGADLLLGRILGRRFLDHRQDHVVIGRVPVRGDVPILAVPGLDAAGAGAFVVRARHLDRLELALE